MNRNKNRGKCPPMREAIRNRPLRDHFSPDESCGVTTVDPSEARRMIGLFLGRAREIEIEIRRLQNGGWLRSELVRVESRRKVRGPQAPDVGLEFWQTTRPLTRISRV